MKTIKQLDSFQPDQQLKNFFRQIHLTQILFTLSVISSSIINMIFASLDHETVPIHQPKNQVQSYDFWAFLALLSASDFFLFLFTSVAELKRQQQRKGSLSFLITVFFKSQIVMIVHYGVRSLEYVKYPIPNQNFEVTSVPLQLVLMASISHAISQPHSVTYFCIKPFQVKTIFKPFFYLALIQFFALRIDIIIAASVQILLSVLKIDKFLVLVSRKIQNKFPTIRNLDTLRYLRSDSPNSQFKQLDVIKTNNSIILQEK